MLQMSKAIAVASNGLRVIVLFGTLVCNIRFFVIYTAGRAKEAVFVRDAAGHLITLDGQVAINKASISWIKNQQSCLGKNGGIILGEQFGPGLTRA